MEITRREAAAILDPPMTEQQVATLIVLAGIPPAGCLRTGLPGRPPNLYDRDAISQAHATEAARTTKQFADNDWIASALLGRDLIIADPAAGTLHWPDGTRAETLTTNIYGVVEAGPEKVPAHRVIWIAAEGEIPLGIEVRHRNRLRWDNRRANLEAWPALAVCVPPRQMNYVGDRALLGTDGPCPDTGQRERTSRQKDPHAGSSRRRERQSCPRCRPHPHRDRGLLRPVDRRRRPARPQPRQCHRHQPPHRLDHRRLDRRPRDGLPHHRPAPARPRAAPVTGGRTAIVGAPK